MNPYYSGDNERNNYKDINEAAPNMEVEDVKLRKAPSVDFNHQIMKRKHTSQIDLEKAKNFYVKVMQIK